MITRSRIFITTAIVCHLLLAPALVTSQTLPPPQVTGSDRKPAPPSQPFPPKAPGQTPGQIEEPVTIRAVHQEKDGSVYHLRGQAEIDYRNYILRADEITYNADTGDSTEDGHVLLDGGPYDEHVESSHSIYNVRTQVGTFYSAIGTVGFHLRASRYTMTTTNPFAFTGKIVEKHGPDHYLVRQGTVTTCQLPRPKWLFEGRHIWVDVDGTAKLYNSGFELMGLPVFYFPYVSFPVQKERQSGLLIPTFGTSSIKGYIVGESAYWAINRSMDAILGADYYSKRGWFERADFRARPSDSSFLFFNYQQMIDRGTGNPRQNQGGEDARSVTGGGILPGLIVELPGERKLKTNTILSIGEHSVRIEAFVCRQPDENHEGVYRFLLKRNRRLYGVAYTLDNVGDIYLVGRMALASVDAAEIDRVLGQVLEAVDTDFNTLLELGFRSSIQKEWEWRVSRGESLKNLEAFAHLIEDDDG